MGDPTRDPPFPDACRTGRMFIAPCCTASTHEFLVDGVLHLALRVAGHGWFEPRPGRMEDINDDGSLVEAGGTERRVRWRADRDGADAPRKLALDSAADWRQQAETLRAMAGAPHLSPDAAGLLRREADAADRQARWWLGGGAAALTPRPARRGHLFAPSRAIVGGARTRACAHAARSRKHARAAPIRPGAQAQPWCHAPLPPGAAQLVPRHGRHHGRRRRARP